MKLIYTVSTIFICHHMKVVICNSDVQFIYTVSVMNILSACIEFYWHSKCVRLICTVTSVSVFASIHSSRQVTVLSVKVGLLCHWLLIPTASSEMLEVIALSV